MLLVWNTSLLAFLISSSRISVTKELSILLLTAEPEAKLASKTSILAFFISCSRFWATKSSSSLFSLLAEISRLDSTFALVGLSTAGKVTSVVLWMTLLAVLLTAIVANWSELWLVWGVGDLTTWIWNHELQNKSCDREYKHFTGKMKAAGGASTQNYKQNL